ncbi:uncharacterized protein Dyak_GE27644, partial [Drosophila yakuba]
MKLALFRLIEAEETEALTIKVRQKVVSQTVLTTFLGGLRGNLGGIVRAWRPQDLEEAYDVAIKERNLYFSEGSAYNQQRQPMRQNDRFRPNYNQYQNRDRDQFQNRPYNQYQGRDRYQYQNRDNNRYNRNTYENNNRNSRYPAILPNDNTPSTSNAAAKKNANMNRPSTNGQRLFNIETNTKTNDTELSHNFEEDGSLEKQTGFLSKLQLDSNLPINLQEFIDGTVNFQRAINKLERNIQSEYAIDSLSTKVGQLQARVEKLLPNRRQKRGLFNGLGNGIKIVTGNLDDSDGRKIQDSLKTISENQKDLTVNKQEVINNDILNRFDNITEHINREQQIINSFLNSYKDSMFKTEFIDGTVNFQRAINKLERNIQSEYAIESLSTKVGQLQARVEKLLPNRRQKRGLFNGLGNGIKIVTGNLDDSDGRRIQDSLKTISENQKDLTVNKQEVINNDILNRFDNITEHINREQQIINSFLNSYKDSMFKT